MKKLLVLGLLSLSLTSCMNSSGTKLTISQVMERNARELLEDERFHSVSIAVYKDGNSTTGHYGELDVNENNAPDDSTLYELASVTKTFTGTLAAQAVLENKISLNDDIRVYMQGEYPNLEFEGKPVRIKHLLTHTSGFPNFPIRGDSKVEFFIGLKEIIIKSEPGTEYLYSNTAPELMAFILETVYKTPYEKLISKYILKPNNMNQTKLSLSKDDKKKLVKGYNENGKKMPNFQMNLWGGIAGLHSTSFDLLKYIKFQLDSTNGVVQESHRILSKTPYDFSLAYYWNILKDEDQIIYRHHGGIYGMQNWLMIFPKYNMGISILSNVSFNDVADILESTAIDIVSDIVD